MRMNLGQKLEPYIGTVIYKQGEEQYSDANQIFNFWVHQWDQAKQIMKVLTNLALE